MMKNNKQCYVYFVSDGHNHIKIGKAFDTFSRMLTLQTGNPFKLKQVMSLMCPSEDVAFKIESTLHKHFEFCQLEGEWFDEEPVIELINRDIVRVDGLCFGGLKYGEKK